MLSPENSYRNKISDTEIIQLYFPVMYFTMNSPYLLAVPKIKKTEVFCIKHITELSLI